MQTRCRVCDAEGNHEIVTAREMMFGTRDEFDYFQCSACGCLQIREIPADLDRYYPPDYYSFTPPTVRRLGGLQSIQRCWRLRYVLTGRRIGRALVAWRGAPNLPQWLEGSGLDPRHRILDVGCGNGRVLLHLSTLGFRDLTGVDPYIDGDVVYPNGVRIRKGGLAEVDGKFDFVMLHHSFEHMPGQQEVMEDLRRITADGRTVLIRVPVASSFAWREYGVDWVQLDAPRHLYLHSAESIRILAERSGFSLDRVEFDSKAFQFWGSEQYRRDIPLHDERSHGQNPDAGLFPEEEIDGFTKKAEELNRKREGDQACFFLTRRSD